jgi:hypothetical protein
MKTIYLLAAISLVGVKLTNAAPALSCENESDPDSGINGNWCVKSHGFFVYTKAMLAL